MSALDEILKEMMKNVPADLGVDRTFGFGDIRRVIGIAEAAISQHSTATSNALSAAALNAAKNPAHDFVSKPIFAGASLELFNVDWTFARLFRASLLIAIYSHTEYLLLSWCESVAQDEDVARDLRRTRTGESYPARYLRFLRDEAGIAIGDFTSWPEWSAIDAYRRARNALAHRGGVVEDPDDRARINTLTSVFVDDDVPELREPLVCIGPGGCEAAIDIAQAFVGRAVAIAERDPRWNGSPVSRGG